MYFISCQFVNFFDLINKNRLKNIFSRIISDLRVWDEISKMLDNNILDIKSGYFYSNEFSPFFDFLSFFLFNVYMLEFDLYVFSLISKFCSRKVIFKLHSINFLDKEFNKVNISPLKLKLNSFNKDKSQFSFLVRVRNKRDYQESDLSKVK